MNEYLYNPDFEAFFEQGFDEFDDLLDLDEEFGEEFDASDMSTELDEIFDEFVEFEEMAFDEALWDFATNWTELAQQVSEQPDGASEERNTGDLLV